METIVTSFTMLNLAANACRGVVIVIFFEKYIAMDENCYSSMWSAVYMSFFE